MAVLWILNCTGHQFIGCCSGDPQLYADISLQAVVLGIINFTQRLVNNLSFWGSSTLRRDQLINCCSWDPQLYPEISLQAVVLVILNCTQRLVNRLLFWDSSNCTQRTRFTVGLLYTRPTLHCNEKEISENTIVMPCYTQITVEYCRHLATEDHTAVHKQLSTLHKQQYTKKCILCTNCGTQATTWYAQTAVPEQLIICTNSGKKQLYTMHKQRLKKQQYTMPKQR